MISSSIPHVKVRHTVEGVDGTLLVGVAGKSAVAGGWEVEVVAAAVVALPQTKGHVPQDTAQLMCM